MFEKRVQDGKERQEGRQYEQEPKIKFDRFSEIPGEIKNTLLHLLSAEYYKLTDKSKEGVPFAENTFDDLRKALLVDQDGVLDEPNFFGYSYEIPLHQGHN